MPSRGPRATLLKSLYFGHLAGPLLLFINCLFLWYKGHANLRIALLAGFTAMWLAIGLASYGMSRNRLTFLERMLNPLVTFYTFIALLLGAEGVLRFFSRSEIYLRPPGTKLITQTDMNVTPGIHAGRKAFSVDNVGLRGPDLSRSDENVYRIVALGGSTTECLFLDDSQDWPHLLMGDLNRRGGRRVWVANAGYSGKTTVDNLKVMQNLQVFRKVQMLILLEGINDLQDALAREGASTNDALAADADGFINGLRPRPLSRGTVLNRSAVYRLVERAVRKPPPPDEMSPGQNPWIWYGVHRKRRGDARVLPLPDLHVALAEYRGRILALADECRALHLRCLFLTQPTMWREDLGPAEQKLQWFGWIGSGSHPKGYASYGDLARAMNAYNQTLLEACAARGMECYDLAAFIPRNTSAMFDDCHFNENGCLLVAHLLSRYLNSHPLPGAASLSLHE